MGRSYHLHKNNSKKTSTEFRLMRWRHPTEEVAKGEDENTPLFDPTRCVRESWTSFGLGWRSVPWGHEWIKGNPFSLRPYLSDVGSPQLSNKFSLQHAHPHPFQGWNFIKADWGSPSRSKEQGTWREKSLGETNRAQEGRD